MAGILEVIALEEVHLILIARLIQDLDHLTAGKEPLTETDLSMIERGTVTRNESVIGEMLGQEETGIEKLIKTG